MSQIRYRRLPGLAILPFQRRSLWLGPDHILAVRTLPFSQHYRRFYFRDIQAMVLAETGAGNAYYYFASAGFLLLMGLLTAFTWHLYWSAFCLISAAAAFLLGMRVPNCACYLQTATSLERLPSLGRKRAAHKTLAKLQPLVESAQGQLTREDIESHPKTLLPPLLPPPLVL